MQQEFIVESADKPELAESLAEMLALLGNAIKMQDAIVSLCETRTMLHKRSVGAVTLRKRVRGTG